VAVPNVYLGPAIIRDPAFICTFDKNPRRLMQTKRLLEKRHLFEVLR